MPTITIPTKYMNKLKELGVYDEWLAEIKKSYDAGDFNNEDLSNSFKGISTFCSFIEASFYWTKTKQGVHFWSRISEK